MGITHPLQIAQKKYDPYKTGPEESGLAKLNLKFNSLIKWDYFSSRPHAACRWTACLMHAVLLFLRLLLRPSERLMPWSSSRSLDLTRPLPYHMYLSDVISRGFSLKCFFSFLPPTSIRLFEKRLIYDLF